MTERRRNRKRIMLSKLRRKSRKQKFAVAKKMSQGVGPKNVAVSVTSVTAVVNATEAASVNAVAIEAGVEIANVSDAPELQIVRQTAQPIRKDATTTVMRKTSDRMIANAKPPTSLTIRNGKNRNTIVMARIPDEVEIEMIDVNMSVEAANDVATVTIVMAANVTERVPRKPAKNVAIRHVADKSERCPVNEVESNFQYCLQQRQPIINIFTPITCTPNPKECECNNFKYIETIKNKPFIGIAPNFLLRTFNYRYYALNMFANATRTGRRQSFD